MNKPAFLLDTGPLSVICGFPINGAPYIHELLEIVSIVLTDEVQREIGAAGKMARIANPLIKQGQISILTTPNSLTLLDAAYADYLGAGERSCIKAAFALKSTLIMDDQDAFLTAYRFGIRPMLFQDWIVSLTQTHGLPSLKAREIVLETARQFPKHFLTHTLALLVEGENAT